MIWLFFHKFTILMRDVYYFESYWMYQYWLNFSFEPTHTLPRYVCMSGFLAIAHTHCLLLCCLMPPKIDCFRSFAYQMFSFEIKNEFSLPLECFIQRKQKQKHPMNVKYWLLAFKLKWQIIIEIVNCNRRCTMYTVVVRLYVELCTNWTSGHTTFRLRAWKWFYYCFIHVSIKYFKEPSQKRTIIHCHDIFVYLFNTILITMIVVVVSIVIFGVLIWIGRISSFPIVFNSLTE